jgi:hypothetical protein
MLAHRVQTGDTEYFLNQPRSSQRLKLEPTNRCDWMGLTANDDITFLPRDVPGILKFSMRTSDLDAELQSPPSD